MRGWVYLIRNRDIYKIGITKNIEIRMRQLKPDNVIAKLYTSDFIKLEREFHNKYKKMRIPQTEYFRLDNHHLDEIKQRLFKLEYPMSIILWIFIKSFLFLFLLLALIFIFLSLTVNDLNIVAFKSILLMQRISFAISFLSLFIHSGKYLSLYNEFKYRSSRIIVFILFGLLFRICSLFLI